MSFSVQQQLEALRLAQVKVVEFHAVQPWLAMADLSGAVAIWNWESQQASSIKWLASCRTHQQIWIQNQYAAALVVTDMQRQC